MLEKLRKMAAAFVLKIREFPSVDEVALAGSVASDDKYPRDCDIAVVISDFSNIDKIAKAARQMSSIFQSWDVFVFDPHRNYRGQICHRKDCPATSRDCYVPGCGEIPYIRLINGFVFDEREMFSRKIEVLWARKNSLLLKWQKDVLKTMGLKSPRKYEVYEDQTFRCEDCDAEFIWKGKEQKHFKEMGWLPPVRCPGCRPARCLACSSPLSLTRKEAEEKGVAHCEACLRMAGLDNEENET
ncbi:zinc-ribbon domain containing protein [bacterium]|nr:zinc-ribbon domain containing protein [bacterium]